MITSVGRAGERKRGGGATGEGGVAGPGRSGSEDNRGRQQRDTNDKAPIAMSLSSREPLERIIDEAL